MGLKPVASARNVASFSYLHEGVPKPILDPEWPQKFRKQKEAAWAELKDLYQEIIDDANGGFVSTDVFNLMLEAAAKVLFIDIHTYCHNFRQPNAFRCTFLWNTLSISNLPGKTWAIN